MRAVSRYGAFKYMNKGSWFLTWRGPPKANARDEGNKIIRKSNKIIESDTILFTSKNNLAEEELDVKLHNPVYDMHYLYKKAGPVVIQSGFQPDISGVPNGI